MQIEERSIEFIPHEQRHGKPSSLITIWFGSNMVVLSVTMGAIASSLGLNLAQALIAIIVGNLFGGLFMAFHSAQGPKLGVPQMIQSRAQFGILGALVPLVIVICIYLGYFSSNGILVGQTLGYFHIPMTPAIILANFVMLLVCIWGYDMIHFVGKWVSILFAIVFVFVTYFTLRIPLPAGSLSLSSVHWGSFLLGVSIFATWQISYAPYVADYSRYLPADTNPAATFWATYLGSVVGTVWLEIIGAILAVTIPNFINNIPGGLISVWHLPLPAILVITMIIGIIFSNSLNLYGAFMAIITSIEPFTKVRGSKRNRIIFVTAICIVGTLISIFASSNFLTAYTNFLALLLFFMIPWTAINIVDFYLLKHGEYKIDDLYDPNGIYGRFNWRALGTYFATVIVELPFADIALYQGPLSKAMGGADLAWIVGGIFASVVYYILGKNALAKENRELLHKKTENRLHKKTLLPNKV